MLRKILAFILFFLALSSYSKNSEESDSLTQIINQIKEYNVHECEFIGISATKSAQWSRFKFLLNHLNDSQFLELTLDSNTVIQSYAYDALIIRKNQVFLLQALSKNRNSQRIVLRNCGCIETGMIPAKYAAVRSLKEFGDNINPELKNICEKIVFRPIEFDSDGKIKK